ncbi:MAG TPA: DNA-processing protein DprA [Candidatus Saccharimonadales bacterium]|nr:DNA-processing protein DprA [Candidatus Saccharimonadales bacterium]
MAGSETARVADPYAVERDAWTVLAAVDGLGPVAFSALLSHYGSGREILREATRPGGTARLTGTPAVSDGERRAVRQPISPPLASAIADAATGMDTTVARVRAAGLRVVTMEEPGYPAALASIDMPPHVLFILGDPAALDRGRSVAIVGTRHATTAGRTIAGRIATALAACGATVVSGLAIGIDGAAHEATVRAGGTTVAVIGGGHAVLSPASHLRLAAAIVGAGGAVVSEHAPDVGPTRGTFPRRNRIISGLSEATVVVEAPARSGALITASWALEQGRECFLVPGPIDAPASAGCLAFLREFQGLARVVAGVPELVADLGLSPTGGDAAERGPVVEATLATLGSTEAAVARHLVQGRITVDEVVAAGDLPVATVLAALGMLERRGLAAGVHGRYRPAGTLLGDATTRRPR